MSYTTNNISVCLAHQNNVNAIPLHVLSLHSQLFTRACSRTFATTWCTVHRHKASNESNVVGCTRESSHSAKCPAYELWYGTKFLYAYIRGYQFHLYCLSFYLCVYVMSACTCVISAVWKNSRALVCKVKCLNQLVYWYTRKWYILTMNMPRATRTQ